MKFFLPVLFIAHLATGCQRMEVPVPDAIYDAKHLAALIGEVKNAGERDMLKESALQLEQELAEFRGFVQRVRSGEISVAWNDKPRCWYAHLECDGRSYYANFHDWNGPVERYSRRDPQALIYRLTFGGDGRLTEAMGTRGRWMEFDTAGRLSSFLYETPDGKGRSVELPPLPPAPR